MNKLRHYYSLVKEDPLRVFHFLFGNMMYLLTGRAIRRVLRRSRECPTCFTNGFCEHCGCPTIPLFLSFYKCKKDGVEHKND
jgi:hypothetical protein